MALHTRFLSLFSDGGLHKRCMVIEKGKEGGEGFIYRGIESGVGVVMCERECSDAFEFGIGLGPKLKLKE
ncbi:putative adhesion G-protein coupled receptor D1 isoform X5 [Sesbania bispinosa]|nr:putative adhesion G-protein coupled receptor D1 isoform X5 [Sesbania bispinosa]